MFNLIPREGKFFELFEQQAAHNEEAAKLFHELIIKWDPSSPTFERLHEIEHEADITTHEIYDKLNRTFVTPFDREDIHQLASELDDVVDMIQSVATRMKLYRVEKTTDDMRRLASILHESTQNVRKALKELGLRDKARRVLDYCIEINRLENAGDRALEQAIGKLFEGKPDPLEVIKWKDFYEGIEVATDNCEDVANTLESILVKNA